MSIRCHCARPCRARIIHGRIVLGIAALIVAWSSPGICGVAGTWVNLNPDVPGRFTSAYFEDVNFISASMGLIVGWNGTIFRTDDRGDTWVGASSGTSEKLLGVDFVDVSTAVAVGRSGTILRSNDGGLTWLPQNSGTQQSLNDVVFVDGQTGTVVGDAGTILGTTDAGATWTPLASPTDEALNAVFFVDAQRGYAAGFHGTIIGTVDGGNSWWLNTTARECSSGHGISQCNFFLDVYFLDASTGFVAGYPAEPVLLVGGNFYKTTGGGGWWFKPAPPPSEFEHLYAIDFGNSTDGMMLRSANIVYHTDDGGGSWTAENLPTLPGAMGALAYGDESTAFAVGGNGAIARWERDVETAVEDGPPDISMQLYQNVPNPFNPATVVRYFVPGAAQVILRVYAPDGTLVRTLVNRHMSPGTHEVPWNGTDGNGNRVASGIYLYSLAVGGSVQTRKMCLLK